MYGLYKMMAFYDFNRTPGQELPGQCVRKVATGEKLTVAVVEAKQGATTKRHAHANEEVIYVLGGKVALSPTLGGSKSL